MHVAPGTPPRPCSPLAAFARRVTLAISVGRRPSTPRRCAGTRAAVACEGSSAGRCLRNRYGRGRVRSALLDPVGMVCTFVLSHAGKGASWGPWSGTCSPLATTLLSSCLLRLAEIQRDFPSRKNRLTHRTVKECVSFSGGRGVLPWRVPCAPHGSRLHVSAVTYVALLTV